MIVGAGLVSLYGVLCSIHGTASGLVSSTEVIAAAKKENTNAIEALCLFSKWLGRVVGDLALVAIPKGGIYISGGLAPVVLEHIGNETFLQQLRDKGRVSHTLYDIPIHIVTDRYVYKCHYQANVAVQLPSHFVVAQYQLLKKTAIRYHWISTERT